MGFEGVGHNLLDAALVSKDADTGENAKGQGYDERKLDLRRFTAEAQSSSRLVKSNLILCDHHVSAVNYPNDS
jgi:hypothetical protein